jgi:nucleoside-diphosphate-sugar epimerase
MKVVITGAAGFIGGETLLKLVDAGHDVLAIDWAMPPGQLIPVPCQWHTGDFSAELGLDSIKRFWKPSSANNFPAAFTPSLLP